MPAKIVRGFWKKLRFVAGGDSKWIFQKFFILTQKCQKEATRLARD